MSKVNPALLSLLECPRCHAALVASPDTVICAEGHTYPVVDGIPVILLPEKDQTIGVALRSLEAANNRIGAPSYIESLGISEEQKVELRQRCQGDDSDPQNIVSYLVAATCGLAYENLIGKVDTYPIPRTPVGIGNGRLLLDVGCNWGRWSVAAAREGWKVVGIDPSLGAVLAAKRAFCNVPDLLFVCGDARFLPFKAASFDCVFSYSVLQHFSETDAELALGEIGRTLRRNGYAQIQMANRAGFRSAYVRTRRNYLDMGIFRVRYWSLKQLQNTFSRLIGPSSIIAEAFGGLGLLPEDRNLVSTKGRLLIHLSELAKGIARYVTPLKILADSVYVISKRQ